MPQPEHRNFPISPIAGGINDSQNETIVRDDQSPRALNVDFNRTSVKSTGGCLKFNNQTAPHSGLLTTVDPGLSPLSLEAGRSVPLRGYGYIPYHEDHDLGGRFEDEGDFLALTDTYHNRRGRSFEFNITFQIPAEEKLYSAPTKGANAPATPTAGWDPSLGFDEALDECFIIVQKGGDRTAPMSWALGVVNIGEQDSGFSSTQQTGIRTSNYQLVFMWYDAPGWGEIEPEDMRYSVVSAATIPDRAGEFSTQALRALAINQFVEPGRTYTVAVQLSLDSGSPGGAGVATSWNDDGFFRVVVREPHRNRAIFDAVDAADGSGGMVLDGIRVIRGPDDSARYLAKYGIRFAGRDAMFLGLGHRFAPWQDGGSIPFGADSAPLEHGGYSMVDRSSTTTTTLYGAATYTLTFAHTNPNAYVEANHQGLVVGNNFSAADPKGVVKALPLGGTGGYEEWQGLGDGTTNFNDEALKGYRLVATDDFTAGPMKGGILEIESYAEVGASYRLTVTGGASLNTWAASPFLVQCFRWHQRPLVLSGFRIYETPRDFEDSDQALADRREWALTSYVELGDESDPDINILTANWPLDDAGGGVLRETSAGRDGFLAPFGLGTSKNGTRGDNAVFLSGEGEALMLDLSANPIFGREFREMLRSGRSGFGFQMTCTIPEAYYSIQQDSLDQAPSDQGGTLGRQDSKFTPDLITWDVKSEPSSGQTAEVKPLLKLTTRHKIYGQATATHTRPAMFSVEVANESDQRDEDPVVHQDLQPWYSADIGSGAAAFNRYSLSADWVGQSVTIQVGVQRSRSADDSYDVYISMLPKTDFMPENGDPSDAELTYWTDGAFDNHPATPHYATPHQDYFVQQHITLEKKDLERSVIVFGGAWRPDVRGYSELNARIILDEVHVFGAAPPGQLPPNSGEFDPERKGKLNSSNSFPPRKLEASDLLLPLGAGVRTVNVTQDSSTVRPSSVTKFFTGQEEDSRDAIDNTYLLVRGDDYEVLSEETRGDVQEEFYLVTSVATGGVSATLSRPYNDATRDNASAACFRHLGYTAFDDFIDDRPLSLGRGRSYTPGVTTEDDVVLTEDFWFNLAPVSANWRLRIYSPLGHLSAGELLPKWTRGLLTARRNRIRGMESQNDTVYAATRGALYEVDDRWRTAGPLKDIGPSLRFRAERRAGLNVAFPVADDRVEYDNPFTAQISIGSHATLEFVIDAWVAPEDLFDFQTIMWVGARSTNPQVPQPPGSSIGHDIHYWIRLNKGRPEWVIGTKATYTGSTQPEKGFYIATSSAKLKPGEKSHIRWVFVLDAATGNKAQRPFCFVNGKNTTVALNARENHASITDPDDWFRINQIVSPSILSQVILGCARDSYLTPVENQTFDGEIRGDHVRPQRLQSWMHGFGGEISQVVVALFDRFTQSRPDSFDPEQIDYTAANVDRVMFAVMNPGEGVGHIARDTGFVPQNGRIMSHPFVSRFHELGLSEKPASFAAVADQMYVANGGRVAYADSQLSKFAGVQPPTTAPTFRLERKPLWAPNVRDASTDDPENDPIDAAAEGAGEQINHFQSFGNSFLVQEYEESMKWEKDDTAGTFGYFGFKAMFNPRSVSGRIPIFSIRKSTTSGSIFVEIRDGRLAVGWYDVHSKQTVYVETNQRVFEPGFWHVLYLRKRWPQDDPNEGNWVNSYWSSQQLRRVDIGSVTGTFQVGETITAPGSRSGFVVKVASDASYLEYVDNGTSEFASADAITGGTSGATATASANAIHPMHDMVVVTRFQKELTTGADRDYFTAGNSGGRNCISLTTEDAPQATGTTATGAVSLPGVTYAGAVAGVVNVDAGIFGSGGPFDPDMAGCYWMWGDNSGAHDGKLYKITGTSGNTQITVTPADDFSGYAAGSVGTVFSGISLRKSEGFDASTQPDTTPADIELFGSQLCLIPENGLTPYDGEFDGFGYVVVNDTDGEDVRVFEDVDSSAASGSTDATCIGTFGADKFIYTSGLAGVGQLQFDSGNVFSCVHCNDYGRTLTVESTQPNQELEVAQSSLASVNAASLFWRYLQSPDFLDAPRRVRVAFFDRDQNVRSNPGPELLVFPSAEDSANPSGFVQLVLENIPVSRDTGNIEREVYMSLGGGVSLFRVAQIPDNSSSTVSVPLIEDDVGQGQSLLFDNAAPPRCGILRQSGGSLLYADLTLQPDAVQFSKPFFPVQVPLANFFRLNSGVGDAVTGLHQMRGRLVIGKRDALFRSIVRQGVAYEEQITDGTGVAAHQTMVSLGNRLYYLSDRGVEVYTGSGVPLWISRNMEEFFTSTADPDELDMSDAARHREKNQLIFLVKVVDDEYPRNRVSVEFDHELSGAQLQNREPALHRFARYEDPNLTAICSVQRRGGGVQRLVGGTEEGFAVWLDRSDANLALIGDTETTWGAQTLTVNGTGSDVALPVTGTIDTELECARGARVRATTGQEAVVLFAKNGRLHLDRKLASVPASATGLTLGQLEQVYETPWLSMGNPHETKLLKYLYLTMAAETSGTLLVEVFNDRLKENDQLATTTPLVSETITLSRGKHRVDTGRMEGEHFKVRLSTPLGQNPGQRFELMQMVFTVQDTERRS